ncbi:MAG: (deoxy)nucleoside triphosphate pyrophosphohydrolase [Oscillospiraceae bacterium]|nr:(deoxy)nucleoside triphosphate pyrophosphohydrolase [Oscillospiraceae bacterium]
MKTIQVVAAVIHEGEQILATQRGYGEFKDGWEFPGGKIEPGENAQQALRREIREELEMEIDVGEHLVTVEMDYRSFHLSMQCFLSKIRSGAPVLKEHEAARWIKPEEFEDIEWLPADRVVIEKLKEIMKRRKEMDMA